MFGVQFSCGEPFCFYLVLPLFAAFFVAIMWDTVLRSQKARRNGKSGWTEINSIPQFQGKIGERLEIVALVSFITMFIGMFACPYFRCRDVKVTLPTSETTLIAAAAGVVALVLHLLMRWHRRRLNMLDSLPPNSVRTYKGIWKLVNWLSTIATTIFMGLIFVGISTGYR